MERDLLEKYYEIININRVPMRTAKFIICIILVLFAVGLIGAELNVNRGWCVVALCVSIVGFIGFGIYIYLVKKIWLRKEAKETEPSLYLLKN